MKKRILIFSIFFAYIFGFYFLCLDKVSAKSYKDETTTYDYNFLKEKVIEKFNVNLDDYKYFSMRTIAYDANWPDVTPQIQFIAWNNAEINVSNISDIALIVSLSNSDDYFSGTYTVKSSFLNKISGTSFELTFNDLDTETYKIIKSDVKGFDSITYNDTVYTFDRIDKVNSDNKGIEIVNDLANITKDYYINLKNNNIKFEFVLIGMFVFSFLIYVLCYMVRRFFK